MLAGTAAGSLKVSQKKSVYVRYDVFDCAAENTQTRWWASTQPPSVVSTGNTACSFLSLKVARVISILSNNKQIKSHLRYSRQWPQHLFILLIIHYHYASHTEVKELWPWFCILLSERCSTTILPAIPAYPVLDLHSDTATFCTWPTPVTMIGGRRKASCQRVTVRESSPASWGLIRLQVY